MLQSLGTEGLIPVHVDSTSKSCYTWYKIHGDLSCGNVPVVCLHGGPGATHVVMEDHADLWTMHKIPVIVYDMIGCGQSTNLDDEKEGDEGFWQMSLFVHELNNLLDFLHLREGGNHLIGHSFGGMLAAEFAATQPAGLRRLILHSPLSSIDLMIRGMDIRVREMPFEIQKALDKGVEIQEMGTEDFKNAYRSYFQHCMCRIDPLPEPLEHFVQFATSFNTTVKTVLPTMLGICPIMTPKSVGSLRDWSVIPRLHNISAKTLLINGEFDQSHDIALQPMFEKIPRVRWATLAGASHCPTMEGEKIRKRFFKLVEDFLFQSDG